MSRDIGRKGYFDRDRRDREWGRNDYRSRPPMPPRNRSRSPDRRRDRERERDRIEKRRSRSPRRSDRDRDALDDNILSEISKLPEPSELWDANQFQDGNFPPGAQPPQPPPPPDYPLEGYRSNYPPSYQSSGLYEDFAPPQADPSGWNQMSLPPPPPQLQQMPQQQQFVSSEDQIKKEAAIESEMRHQKAALSKQREDYMRKANILKKELETLKDQRNELRGDPKRSPSPDTKRFLKENTKLQLEIQNKLKTITNVVDMLNGIIGEGAQHVENTRDSDDSPERSSTKRRSRSQDDNKKFNYVYYDPEMHWCRVCNDFPPTAKDYLNHLHSPSHNKMAAAHMEAPWHSVTGVNEGFPSFASAPTKRTPIRGLQFFVPSTAWYCKLCDQFIGDLHCASAHLKSIQHSNNYTNFVEQNPHWETDWMSDRQKAFEKARASNKNKIDEKASYSAHTITFDKDGFHTTKPRKSSPPAQEKKKEKKKKSKKSKRSSSSSSSSSSSDSENKKRKSKSKKRNENSAALQEWMAAMQRDDQRKLLHKIHNMKEQNEKNHSPERNRAPSESNRNRERERDRSEGRRRERSSPGKKPEIRKMPFIGKMPIYKNLGKKSEEEKKREEGTKKKEGDDESAKRRQQEIDAEIQKKVAEFKEKIAKAQLERQHEQVGALLPPPHLMLAPPPMPMAPPAPPPPPAPPALPQDFQDALDIIFPPEVKKQAAEMVKNPDFIASMQQGLQPGFPGMPGAGLLPNPFLPPGVMQQMPLMGFDLNSQLNPQLFTTRPQLYPLANSPKPRPNNNTANKNKPQNRNNNNKTQYQKPNSQTTNQSPTKTENKIQNGANETEIKKKREEMDDLAMLGIDASDVGAGM